MRLIPRPPQSWPDGLRRPVIRVKQGVRFLDRNKKRFFWAWVAYQAIKGTLTLSLIWIPLFLIWWNNRGG